MGCRIIVAAALVAIAAIAAAGWMYLQKNQRAGFGVNLLHLQHRRFNESVGGQIGRNLSRAVPVELRYETVTVEDGKLHIYRDVYDRGANTEDNLRNMLRAYWMTVDQLSEGHRSQVTNALSQMARGASCKPVIQP